MKFYKVNFKKIFSILILSIVMFSLIGNISYADEKYEVKTTTINNDMVFKGVSTSQSIYFSIDKWWDVHSVDIDINISINQIVDKTKDAYITFNINGTPFYSHKLEYDPKKGIENLKVSIPKDNLLEGSNELKIEGYCRLTDKPCVDDANSANWLVIKKQSKINVNYTKKLANNEIGNFPYPFMKTESNDLQKTSIVIPDNYSDGQLRNAFLLLAHLGSKNENNKNNIEILKYSDLAKTDNNSNIIFISDKKSIPTEILGLFNNVSNIDLSNKGYINLINSPYESTNSNSKLMLIVSDDENYLLKSIRVLMNEELISEISKDSFIVDESVQEIDKIVPPKDTITFKEMGTDNLEFKGAYERSSTIGYTIPRNKTIANDTKIKLKFKYADNLDFNRALVTVYVNNIPIGSKKLARENELGDELELTIPNNLVNGNFLEVKVGFNLAVTGSYCSERTEETPWALVEGSSYIHLQTNDESEYFFNTYPSPFISDNKFNDVLLSVPDILSSKELTSLGKVFEIMGKDLSNNSGDLDVSRYSNLNGREKNKNLIVYGTPTSNKLIKDINNDLWFAYDSSYTRLLGNEKLYLVDKFDSTVSAFQLDKSPYKKAKAMLILTSANTDSLANSLVYLGDEKKIPKLTGDSVLVDEKGEIRTFKFKKEDTKSTYEKVKGLNYSSKVMLGVISLIVLFLITIVSMYFIKNKKSK